MSLVCFQAFANVSWANVPGLPIALIRCVQSLLEEVKMKSITSRFFLFAATTLFLGTTAFGQTTMKGDVPFSFNLSGGALKAGNYIINVDANGSGKVVRLYNVDTHEAVASITYKAGGGPADDNSPRLIFRCNHAGCALSEIWTPYGGYAVPKRRARAGEYLASIPLTFHQGS
jgi:hypothetical protein